MRILILSLRLRVKEISLEKLQQAGDLELKKQFLYNLILNQHSEKFFLHTMGELLFAPEVSLLGF